MDVWECYFDKLSYSPDPEPVNSFKSEHLSVLYEICYIPIAISNIGNNKVINLKYFLCVQEVIYCMTYCLLLLLK